MRRFELLRWNSFFLVIVFLALFYLVAYSFFVRRPQQEVVKIFFADRITAAHRYLIDKYNALNAGKVEVIPIDFPNLDFSTNERKEILARSLRGEGDGIDLLAVDVIWVQRFAKWCEPLGTHFSQQELQRIIPDALYSCYNDGDLVAVPLDLVLGVMYYREDLVRQMPGGDGIIRSLASGMTWDQFIALRGRYRGKGPFYVFPAAGFEGFICGYIENLLSLQPDYFSKSGFSFDTPEGKKALQLFVDIVQKSAIAPPIVTTFTEVPSYEYYVKNDGLFLHGWTSYDKDFTQQPYDWNKQQFLRKAPLPRFAGGHPSSMFGGWDLMVSRFSTKKDAVIDFVKFLLTDESQESFYARGGYYPVITSFYDNPASVERHPEIAGIKELMRFGVHRPPVKDYTNNSKIMAYYLSLAVKGKITVDSAVREATRAIQSAQASVETR